MTVLTGDCGELSCAHSESGDATDPSVNYNTAVVTWLASMDVTYLVFVRGGQLTRTGELELINFDLKCAPAPRRSLHVTKHS